ncbi:hypothetical protein P4284_23100 [Bacillus swezeyi]|uniref:hypothetical protein n=1 Tax=Bacillus swezeyi TaxID=1925020 RepID=UPI002E250B8D|nr:hypothetical protein [Bacillus swezeyi]MED2979544.1 hypothetical protein [Bacillus swezeyi]
MTDKEREELTASLMHMKNAIVSLYEHVAPDFTTRDFAILKYGLSSEESGKLEKYLVDHHVQNKAPTKEKVRSKLAEIQDLPEDSIPMKKVEDLLKGYQADGIMDKMIKKILK